MNAHANDPPNRDFLWWQQPIRVLKNSEPELTQSFRAPAGPELFAPSGFRALRSQFQVRDAEDCALGFVGETYDFPAVRQHDLLHHSQAQAGALLLGREVRFED